MAVSSGSQPQQISQLSPGEGEVWAGASAQQWQEELSCCPGQTSVLPNQERSGISWIGGIDLLMCTVLRQKVSWSGPKQPERKPANSLQVSSAANLAPRT